MNCLDEILNFYKNKDPLKSQIIRERINNILINLMGALLEDNPKNLLKVRNCLILLLHLFFETEFADNYNSIGISVNEIPNQEKERYLEILRSEVISIN